jgi:hypothetical protein
MPCSAVTPVVILGIPGEELSHYAGDPLFAALKQDVTMVVHKHPGIDRTSTVHNNFPEALKESGLILPIFKYLRFV